MSILLNFQSPGGDAAGGTGAFFRFYTKKPLIYIHKRCK